MHARRTSALFKTNLLVFSSCRTLNFMLLYVAFINLMISRGVSYQLINFYRIPINAAKAYFSVQIQY